MKVYIATAGFSLPILSKRVSIGEAVGKLDDRIGTLIGTIGDLVNAPEYSNLALYQWVGSDDSLNYLSLFADVDDPTAGSLVFGGSKSIESGDDEVVVTGAGWGFVPSSIVATVVKPTDGDDTIFATIREDTVTADGFSADLSGNTDKAGYKLYYLAVE